MRDDDNGELEVTRKPVAARLPTLQEVAKQMRERRRHKKFVHLSVG
jgi:hypothetical protein